MLLWYAGVTACVPEAKENALKYLRALAKNSRIKKWPGALGLFVLGDKSREDVLAEVIGSNQLDAAISVAKDDLLKRRYLAKALFYLASRKRSEGDEEACKFEMAECASLDNPVLEIEWYLACAEVDRTKTERAQS